MADPRVSVICIFYNERRFLAEAVDSVLGQSFADFELILADDGSSDESSTTARAYAERFPGRVRYTDHPAHANRGMSATRNHALAIARGELVAFIDADDVWLPRKLAEQVALLDAVPEAAMVCGAVNYWSSWNGGSDRIVRTGHLRDGLCSPPEAALALYPLGAVDAPCPSDVMVRRSAVEAVGGFEAHFVGPLQMYEDMGFFVKIYLAAGVYFSTRVWLKYRQHEESCGVTVKRKGLYVHVRTYFLDWLSSYVADRAIPDKARVLRALRFARWRMKHSPAEKVFRRANRTYWMLAGRAAHSAAAVQD